MKNLALATVLVAASLAGSSASADGFTGATAPANFAVADVGTLIGSSPILGFATFSATQLILVGSNTVSPSPATQAPGCSGGVYGSLPSSPCQLQVTLNLPGTYSFDWSYVTADADGPPGDIFGVMVDGSKIALSASGGAISQLGSASFVATSSFGWIMNCTDCIGGFANATVSNFVFTSAPVPEPMTAALMLAGGLGLAATRRWQRAVGH